MNLSQLVPHQLSSSTCFKTEPLGINDTQLMVLTSHHLHISSVPTALSSSVTLHVPIRLWTTVAPSPRDWNHQLGRPRHIWLQTVESDLAPLNIGLATAYRLAQNRQTWSTLVGTAMSCTRKATWWWWPNGDRELQNAKHWLELAWPHPFIIYHRTPEGRSVPPLCRLTRVIPDVLIIVVAHDLIV